MKAVYGRSGGLPAEVHRHYLAPFPTPDSRQAPWCFAKAIIGESEWLAELWHRRHVLESKPLQIVWGMEDPVGTTDKLQRWQAAFPNHRAALLDNVGHFVPEQLGAEMARIIDTFIGEASGEAPSIACDPARKRIVS